MNLIIFSLCVSVNASRRLTVGLLNRKQKRIVSIAVNHIIVENNFLPLPVRMHTS